MKIGFYTPIHKLAEHFFGAATFGFVGRENEEEDNIVFFKKEIEGVQIAGTYDECLNSLRNDIKPQAAIVLFGNAGNENIFLKKLSKIIACPIVGGGAAINPETGEKGLLSAGAEVNLFMVKDDSVEVEVEYLNIHSNILGMHKLTFENPRELDKIDGENAKEWFDRTKKDKGFSDFEHITFSTAEGINAHFSIIDGKVVSGRNLEERMILRYIEHEKVFDRIREFYDDDNAIVFGCAGLKSILDKPLNTKSLGLFMFGEICYINGEAEFGNLMLSKIRLKTGN